EEEEEEEEQTVEPPAIVDDLSSKQPPDFNVDFSVIPHSSALTTEVQEMSQWCHDLRMELQTLIFPLRKQQPGEMEEEAVVPNEANGADNASNTSVEVTGTNVDDAHQQHNESEVKAEDVEQVQPNYKDLNKQIEELISPLLNADLSKSIVKSTGLSKIILIILSKPEFSSACTKRLSKWWVSNFDFSIKPDHHWSDEFTIADHLQEEKQRKAMEEERRRKKKEERRLASMSAVSQTPETEPQSSNV
ncbi:hypothetical protein JL09_g5961, partial [Pichia kudriavzevii]